MFQEFWLFGSARCLVIVIYEAASNSDCVISNSVLNDELKRIFKESVVAELSYSSDIDLQVMRWNTQNHKHNSRWPISDLKVGLSWSYFWSVTAALACSVFSLRESWNLRDICVSVCAHSRYLGVLEAQKTVASWRWRAGDKHAGKGDMCSRQLNVYKTLFVSTSADGTASHDNADTLTRDTC